jgi:LysR family transcriptional regulator, regulator of gene expression of beta-lactamase
MQSAKTNLAVEVMSRGSSGPVFDTSSALAEVAIQGQGVALLPLRMFARELHDGSLVQPFKNEIALGRYWLTCLRSKPPTAGMKAFQQWLLQECHEAATKPVG